MKSYTKSVADLRPSVTTLFGEPAGSSGKELFSWEATLTVQEDPFFQVESTVEVTSAPTIRLSTDQ